MTSASLPPRMLMGHWLGRVGVTGFAAGELVSRRQARKDCTMGIVAWIVVGAIAGFVANIIAGGREGVIGTIVLGIVGGLVGGFAATEIFHYGSVNGINVESVLIAIAGAVVVLFVWRLFTARSTGRSRL